MATQHQYYLDQQLSFLKHLNTSVRKSLLVRLYPREYGWDHLSRLQDKFKELRYETEGVDFFDSLRKRRLVVTDNNQTTFLQFLGLNIPTVIFWDKKLWPLNEAAQPFFDKLKAVNIFHETPESAAEFINQKYDDIASWWHSQPVQDTVTEFCWNFARTSPDWTAEWHKVLGEELKKLKYEEIYE